MKDQQINTFGKGMINDLGHTLPQEGSYTYGENIRILSDGSSSGSSGVVVNVNGTEFFLDVSVYGALPALYTSWVGTGSLTPQTLPPTAGGFTWAAGSYLYIEGDILHNTGIDILIEDQIAGAGASTIHQHITYEYIDNAGESIVVFNLGELNVSLYESISDELGVVVIGHASVRDFLVLFVKLVGGDFEGTDAIVRVDMGSPDLTQTLLYISNKLGFSVDHPIEAVARYESDLTQRVYWTDGLNTVKTINIVDEDVLDLPFKYLNLVPPVNMSPLKVESIFSGGSLKAGMYQYAYRLKTREGLETRFTPFSNPVHVVDRGNNYWMYEEDPELVQETHGTAPGETTNASVFLSVTDIDTDYDLIEFAAIYRDSIEGVEDVYVFSTRVIASSTVKVSHLHSKGEYSISLDEALAFALRVDSAKTIATVDNVMFLGNVKENTPDIEFNSRAFRYKRYDAESNHFPYKSTDDVTTYAPNPNSTDVPSQDDEDINPFNDLDGNDLTSSKKFKYQKDGVTLGGEGPYVSYKFIKRKLSGDTLMATTTSVPPFISSSEPATGCEGVVDSGSEGDYKSGVVASSFKGYQRDEVYRFGIVLHDLRGNPNFVSWVGDIRFPSMEDIHMPNTMTPSSSGPEGTFNFSLSQTEYSESGASYFWGDDDAHQDFTKEEGSSFPVSDSALSIGEYGATGVAGGFTADYEEANGGKHTLYALGIEFDVTIPADIKPLVSGYSIVRVEREERDKTVLAVGMVNYFTEFGSDLSTGQTITASLALSRNLYYLAGNPSSSSTGHRHKWHGRMHKHLLSFDSPEFPFTNNYPSAGECVSFQYYGGLSNGGEPNAYRNGFINDHENYRKFFCHSVQKFKPLDLAPRLGIGDMRKLQRGAYEESLNFDLPTAGTMAKHILNKGKEVTVSSTGTTGHDFVSVGEETLYIRLNKEPSFGESNDALMAGLQWENYLHHYGQTTPDYPSGMEDITGVDDIGVGAYEKLLGAIRKDLGDGEGRTQYGGPGTVARASNIYISTGASMPITDSGKLEVYGGDTFVTFYDLEKTRKYGDGIDGAALHNDISARGYAYAFPVETSINTTLRKGYHFANKDDFDLTDNVTMLGEFLYETAYSAENDIQLYFPRNTLRKEPENFDARIVYSSAKDNNEHVDSWRSFKAADFKDLSGRQGSIEKLATVNDSLFFIQTQGVGYSQINPLSTTLDQSGSAITLGKGETIADIKYISRYSGTEGIHSAIVTESSLYWVDKTQGKIYTIGEAGAVSISDSLGVKNIIAKSLSEDYKITLGYDRVNNEVLFSIAENTTVVYSEVLKKFTGVYNYSTPLFISHKEKLFSIPTTNRGAIYMHNSEGSHSWYEDLFESSIEFLVNKHPIHTKVFDIIEWYTASNTNMFDSATFSNSNPSDTQGDDLSEAASKERTTRMPVPRTSAQYRFRDAYMKVRLTTSKEFTLHYVKTSFRISKR